MSLDDAPFPEPFGPIYERPASAPCPDCECCSAALCGKARAELAPCSAFVDGGPDQGVMNVNTCPCAPLGVAQ